MVVRSRSVIVKTVLSESKSGMASIAVIIAAYYSKRIALDVDPSSFSILDT